MDRERLRRIFDVSLESRRDNPVVVWQVDLEELEYFRWMLAFLIGEDSVCNERLLRLKSKVDEMIASCYLTIAANKKRLKND